MRDINQTQLFSGRAHNRDLSDITSIDIFYTNQGYTSIAGVDEAGRGALAGPVCAAAVILSENKISGLNDSKKLTPDKRISLYNLIWENALSVGVAMVGPAEIDRVNILQASLRAMELAVKMLVTTPGIVLVDGNQVPAGLDNAVAIVKGDTKSQSIMAASIIAKVTRDRFMAMISSRFPGYGFEVHKGYGVKSHIDALREKGPTNIHRLTFSPCRDLISYLQEPAGTGTIVSSGSVD